MNEKLIEKIIDWGCSCDMLNGYYCGHIKIAEELDSALNPPADKIWDSDKWDWV